MTDEDERVLKATLENLLKANAMLDGNMGKLIAVIGSMQERISALETAARSRPKLVDMNGARIN